MGLKLVSPPAAEPFTTAEAKVHLRITASGQDAVISRLIAAARRSAERFTGRALIEQTWDLFLDEFPGGHWLHHHRTLRGAVIEIPKPPLIEVEGVFYTDSSGDEQEMDAGQYVVADAGDETLPGRVVLLTTASWPTPARRANAVRIRFRAGYLDTSSPPVAAVPDDIEAAMLLTIGHLFANRESVIAGQRAVAVTLPLGVEELLRAWRVDLGFA